MLFPFLLHSHLVPLSESVFVYTFDITRNQGRTMASPDNVPPGRLNGNSYVESEIAELDLALQRLAGREGLARSLVDETPDGQRNAIPSLTSSTANLGSRFGSVFHTTAPQSQDFRLQNSTVFRPETTPISSPVFTGFFPNEVHESGRRGDENESRARYDREIEEVMNPGHGEMVSRLKEVQDYYQEAFPKESDIGFRVMNVVGDSRNLPLSPQIQSSPSVQLPARDQDSSGMALDRFRAGRESLSVLQNITRRESKRPKARSQDRDYKRRFSTSGQIPPLPVNRGSGFSPMGRTPI